VLLKKKKKKTTFTHLAECSCPGAGKGPWEDRHGRGAGSPCAEGRHTAPQAVNQPKAPSREPQRR
jgi:hypothetical protein